MFEIVYEKLIEAIENDDVEKARNLSRVYYGPFLITRHLTEDLIYHTFTNKNPEICNEYVAPKRKTDILKLLLRSGVDPNTVLKKSLPSNGNEFCVSEERSIPNAFTLLHIAARNENEEMVKLVLDAGVKPTIDEFCSSLLDDAVTMESLPIVAAILNSECGISSISLPDSQDNCTPIHLAIINDHEDIVSLLLEKGMYDNHACKRGFTPLYSAAEKGNTKIIEILLRYDQVTGGRKSTFVKSKGKWLEGYVAMYLAAIHGHIEVVQIFLNLGIDPNANFKEYLTPLNAAVLNGHKDIVTLLLDSGANLNPKGKKGDIENKIFPPIFQAVLHGYEYIVKLVLNSGADIHVRSQNIHSKKEELNPIIEEMLTYGSNMSQMKEEGYTAIHCAAGTGNASMVKLLLERGADVNAKSNHNNTPLFVAVFSEFEEAAACLLEAGADVEGGAEDRQPFFTAIQTGNLGIVELLFKYMDPLKLASRSFLQNGCTPLQYSVAVERAEIVEFLLKNGALVNHYVEGDFPLHYAIELCNREIVSKLIMHGANVNNLCLRGATALFHAITKNDIDMCKFLLKKGSSLKEKTDEGLSLLNYAILERCDKKMIKFLVECGADLTEILDGLLPIELLIGCAMADHGDEITKGNTEDIQDNDELVTILKLCLDHGCPLTKPEHTDSEVRSPFLSVCGLGYVAGVKLLLNYDTDFDQGLKELEKTMEKMIFRLRTKFGIYADKVELEIFNFDSFGSPKTLSDPRMLYLICPNCDYDAFREECERLKKITRLMTQRIAKMEVGGMEIKEKYMWLVNSAYAQNFYRRCKKELQEMKDTVISGRATYFDLLRANEEQFTAYAGNEGIIEVMEGSNFGKMFPLYSEDLSYQIERGVKRRKLLEMSSKFLSEAFEIENEIPVIISNKIFNYLSSIDLRNLCRIHNPYIFVSADISNV